MLQCFLFCLSGSGYPPHSEVSWRFIRHSLLFLTIWNHWEGMDIDHAQRRTPSKPPEKSCSTVTVISALFGLGIVVLACGLIASVVVVYVGVCLPLQYPRDVAPVQHYVCLGIMMWISFNVIFNYVAALAISPNCIPVSHWLPAADHSPTHGRPLCSVCRVVRPMRARHCYFCGHCVQKMDHHCPWINSCVGHHNHRYFLMFLVYLAVGTAWCGFGITNLKGAMRLPLGWQLWSIPQGPSWSRQAVSAMDHFVVLFVQILCAAIFAAMIGFVGWCGYLVLTNQTAYEYAANDTERDRWHRIWRQRTIRQRQPLNRVMWHRACDVVLACTAPVVALTCRIVGAMLCRSATIAAVSVGDPGCPPPYRSPFDMGWRRNLMQLFVCRDDGDSIAYLRGGVVGSMGQTRTMRTATNRWWWCLSACWRYGLMPSLSPLALQGVWWPRWDASILDRSPSLSVVPHVSQQQELQIAWVEAELRDRWVCGSNPNPPPSSHAVTSVNAAALHPAATAAAWWDVI